MRKGFLHDEQGSQSFARLLLALEVVFLWGVGIWDAASSNFSLSGSAWSLHAGLVIALVAWAGGPRAMQYLGPQVGKTADAVSAWSKGRLRGTDDHRKDDERG